MATRQITLKGEAYWAKLREGQEDMGFEKAFVEFGGVYSIELDLDPENLGTLKGSGSAAQRNGNGRFRFKRKKTEKQDWLPGGTPTVTKDGSLFTDMIPNGSIVEVDLSVYDTAYKAGTRLEAVRVLTLAEMPDSSANNKEESEVPF